MKTTCLIGPRISHLLSIGDWKILDLRHLPRRGTRLSSIYALRTPTSSRWACRFKVAANLSRAGASAGTNGVRVRGREPNRLRTRSGGYHTPDPGLGQSLVRERGGWGGVRPRLMLSPPAADWGGAIMSRMALTFSTDFVSGGRVPASDVCGYWCAYRSGCCCPLERGAG